MTQFEPIKLGPIYSLEEMDMKVLQFQNKKLVERIEQRRKAEDDLKRRIEQLEQRQTTDDAVMCIVNRYWNQLDEDVRVLLQRFDAEGADESEKKNESVAVTSFLTLLSQWNQNEIEDELGQRVEFSKRAIGKLVTAFDRLMQRNQKLWECIKDKVDEEAANEAAEDETKPDTDAKKESKEEGDEEKKDDAAVKDEKMEEDKDEKPDEKAQQPPEKPYTLQEGVREDMDRLMAENTRLQKIATELQEKHHRISIKNSESLDKHTAAETEVAELKNQVEELEYYKDIAESKVEKLDRFLADAMVKLKTYQEGEVKVEGGGEGVSKNKFSEVTFELEEQRELATNRLTELEKLQKEHLEAKKEIEKLKMDLSTLPESVIVESTEYKCLKSQFSVLYNESMKIKTQLEEARNLLASSKNTHLRQIEQMEGDELSCQKKLRTEFIQLEDQFAQVRREYQMLRIEFEQQMAANEQTGPINREMRNLISSLKNHNEQLKGEVARYKRKLKEAQTELAKYKVEGKEPDTPGTDSKDESSMDKILNDIVDDTKSEGPSASTSANKDDSEAVRDLKAELKKALDRERELKLLLDMYKSAPKESRDKVQLMGAEKKARQENEELRAQLRRMQENEKRERRKLADDDAIRKIKRHEETISELQKNLAAQKQEEEALLNEMEVTGQAFEDMQEQNIRLLQQLREKDDANFKLMSERIKSNQIHKLMREEKDTLGEQVNTILSQVEAQNQVVRQLEEKERHLQNNLATTEKELSLRQQALELHKRKAIENAQTAADLKLHLDKYHSQLKEVQLALQEKTGALTSQTFKFKRNQEDVASLRRKVERAKKIEMASSADEVLLEEIREYKEQLTCPSCKVKKKDAILTKCFHVFCLDCLKTRYETRQRKCPKCNAAFGANDYHRIYLE